MLAWTVQRWPCGSSTVTQCYPGQPDATICLIRQGAVSNTVAMGPSSAGDVAASRTGRGVRLNGSDRWSTRPPQEVDDQVCRRFRLLLGDPVPAIRDDRIFHVIGDTPDHRTDHRSERSVATEGQDRLLKHALRKERSVVGRILAERPELSKARSHGAGSCIERRITPALRFIKSLRFRGSSFQKRSR